MSTKSRHNITSPPRNSVLCPNCGAEGRVVDGHRVGDIRVRRRKCDREGCGTDWRTTEGGDDVAVADRQRLRALEAECDLLTHTISNALRILRGPAP
jgi:transcriptional regulator NrdR family protein